MPPQSAPKFQPDRAPGRHPEALRQLAERLDLAVATLRALPRDAGTAPAGARSAWPEMVRRSRFVIEGTREAAGPKPSPEASMIWTGLRC